MDLQRTPRPLPGSFDSRLENHPNERRRGLDRPSDCRRWRAVFRRLPSTGVSPIPFHLAPLTAPISFRSAEACPRSLQNRVCRSRIALPRRTRAPTEQHEPFQQSSFPSCVAESLHFGIGGCFPEIANQRIALVGVNQN